LKNRKLKKIGFYVYSYYQAKDVINVSKNYNILPFLVFKYNLAENIGLLWIDELTKLLINEFKKKNINVVIDCKKNPALTINSIRYGFSYINFSGNKVLQKKILGLAKKFNIKINQKIEIYDLKNIKNCNLYINKILRRSGDKK
tara:strand:+ start:29707 stop:30138 length:432 start_codon:yes stop_codon:yes gene_type:complete